VKIRFLPIALTLFAGESISLAQTRSIYTSLEKTSDRKTFYFAGAKVP